MPALKKADTERLSDNSVFLIEVLPLDGGGFKRG
jgi:hypothetical protein